METAPFAATQERFFFRSSKTCERLSIDIVGPKAMTRSKTNTFSQWWMRLVRSRLPSLSGTSRLLASSSVFRQFFTIFGTPGIFHFDRGPQFVSSEFQNFCRQNGVATSKTTSYHRFKTNATTELCGRQTTNRPLSDCECVLPSALSATRTLINTATMESPHDRFFCFKRREPLIRPSKSATWQTLPLTSGNSYGQKTKLRLCLYKYPK